MLYWRNKRSNIKHQICTYFTTRCSLLCTSRPIRTRWNSKGNKKNINYERNREISNRNEVHKTQIELASRNNTLMIDTLNLLQLYEKLLKGNISKQRAIDYINSKIGLFYVLKIEKN